MLSSLTLNNFALFKKQTVEFSKGFNCLLGQSGAGKSILIDAFSFVLGAKSDKSFLRSGENTMRVDGVFNQISDECKQILSDWDIECDDEIIISRTLSQDGKNAIKVNGVPVTLKMLVSLTSKMADFCGQHESVGLLNVANHLSLLDKYAGEEVEIEKEVVSQLFGGAKEVKSKISSLGGSESERAREKDLLSFQVNEIENAHLDVSEVETLKQRFDFISSSEKIFEKLSEVLQKISENRDSVTSLLYDAKSELSGFSNFKEIDECRERIENSYYEMQDVAENLQAIKQSTDFDPNELDRIDRRLDLIKSLSKKYGGTVEQILDYQEKCQQRLEQLEQSEQILDKLQAELQQIETQLDFECQKLSNMRKKYASQFEKEITNQLEDLEMHGTIFKIQFERCDHSSKGCDNVKFMFSANQGQNVVDLHKTASGGELSRLLLAFKNIMLDKEKVQTVVFDEIDSGISGVTAGKVAEKLVNISKFTQIICITHTPVVASKGDEFILVEKAVTDGQTISTAANLSSNQAVYEVARLIDESKEVSETALLHASKLFGKK